MMLKSLVSILFLFTFSFSSPLIDIDSLSKQARTQHKHLLLFFHKFGCSFCEKMQDVTLDDEKIEVYIEKNFIFVDMGIDDEGFIKHNSFQGTKHAYAQSLEISFYPTVGFIDGNNSIVYGVIGYRPAESFMQVLKYIESDAYKRMDLETFKTKLDFEEE